MSKFRILFMGTPDFAEISLKALVESGENVVGVVCREDKPVGRKQIMTPPPVKAYALSVGIPVYQPKTLRDGSFMETLRSIDPDMIIVVAYGRILPDEILNYPIYGCYNVHASLLPKLRGSSPIQWSIVSGEKETGITLMKMSSGLDEGDIVLQTKTEISDEDTGESLWDRLSQLGASTLLQGLERFYGGDYSAIAQDHAIATYAPMLTSKTGHIDWTKSADEISKIVRGLYSWPGAYCIIDQKRVKLIKVSKVSGQGTPGCVISSDEKNGVVVACSDGGVRLNVFRMEGSREMEDTAYLRGHSIPIGTIIE